MFRFFSKLFFLTRLLLQRGRTRTYSRFGRRRLFVGAAAPAGIGGEGDVGEGRLGVGKRGVVTAVSGVATTWRGGGELRRTPVGARAPGRCCGAREEAKSCP